MIAIGVGLLIGLERERSDVEAREETPDAAPRRIGVRTLALLSLFGWVAGFFAEDTPWLPVAALGAVAAMVTVLTARAFESHRGLTTEVAALITFMLGMMVHKAREVAVALGLATTLLLISKPWFESFVQRLRRMDLSSTVQLAILLAIVVPLLPEEARDPWHVLSPRRIGVFVALIAGISYIGYFLNRFLGGRRAVGIAGLVGGLASSTALTAAVAQQAKQAEDMTTGQLAAMLATTVMYVRVLVVCAFVSLAVAGALVVPLGAMGLTTLGGVAWKYLVLRDSRSMGREGGSLKEVELSNPFSILPALKWGAIFAAILVISALAQAALGELGLVATGAVSGLVDVDAVTLTAAHQVATNGASVRVGALAITAAVVANAVVKAGIAWVGGGRKFGADIAKVFGASIVVGLAVALLWL